MPTAEAEESSSLTSEAGTQRDLPLDMVIARRLVQEIIGGVYAPGDWIREQEVASRYGTSRTPVRNAFRQVEREGFILVRPWRGAKVLELSADDTRYVLDMLEAVYGVASGSSFVHDVLNRVGSLALWQHRFLDFDVPAARHRQAELHRGLVAAIKVRDGAAAEACAREIVALTRSFLVPRVGLQADKKVLPDRKRPRRAAKD
jgi:GntR family transcriptional regulator, rspAB operon transcriptional repressor